METPVWSTVDESGKYRAVIFQRQDGTFGFDEEHFSDVEFEQCWVPVQRNPSFFDSLETALREVHSRVDWLVGKE